MKRLVITEEQEKLLLREMFIDESRGYVDIYNKLIDFFVKYVKQNFSGYDKKEFIEKGKIKVCELYLKYKDLKDFGIEDIGSIKLVASISNGSSSRMNSSYVKKDKEGRLHNIFIEINLLNHITKENGYYVLKSNSLKPILNHEFTHVYQLVRYSKRYGVKAYHSIKDKKAYNIDGESYEKNGLKMDEYNKEDVYNFIRFLTYNMHRFEIDANLSMLYQFMVTQNITQENFQEEISKTIVDDYINYMDWYIDTLRRKDSGLNFAFTVAYWMNNIYDKKINFLPIPPKGADDKNNKAAQDEYRKELFSFCKKINKRMVKRFTILINDYFKEKGINFEIKNLYDYF